MNCQGFIKQKLISHIKETLRLALPSAIARAGIVTMGVVDTVMVSRYSTMELAYFGISNSIVMLLVVVIISLTTGIPVVCSQEYGAGNYKRCLETWFSSLPYCIIIGLISIVVCFFADKILILSGQDYDIAEKAGDVSKVFAYSFPFIIIYVCSAGFLEGIKRPSYAMVVIFVANLFNVFFNWVFIYGKFGFKPMGAVGASWATVVNRGVVAFLMLAYILPMMKGHNFNWKHAFRVFDKKNQKMRRIGYGAAFSKGSEVIAFFIVTMFAGYLGTMALATFSIANNLIGFFYMISAGFAAAATVRVGIAAGRKDSCDVAFAGWTALFVNLGIMLVLSFFVNALSEPITAVYTKDVELIPMAKKVIDFAGWIIIVNGGQFIAASALRGRGDVLIPAIIQALCSLVLMSVGAWVLAFNLGLGVTGLLFGMMIANFIATIILAARFSYLSKKDSLSETFL
ncbi:MAG: MATE family efflux transporter [Alphaproteobacteria bacterium]